MRKKPIIPEILCVNNQKANIQAIQEQSRKLSQEIYCTMEIARYYW